MGSVDHFCPTRRHLMPRPNCFTLIDIVAVSRRSGFPLELSVSILQQSLAKTPVGTRP